MIPYECFKPGVKVKGPFVIEHKEEAEEKKDVVNSPPHYTYSKIEVIDAIEAWNLPYHLGNAVKYIARAGHKGDAKEDIQKAIWYLQRWLDKEGK